MLNRIDHEIRLKQILRDIYKTSDLSSNLAFKGGTCLYFFYDLPRFSTDLDFNLLSDQFDAKSLEIILKKYLRIDDFANKYNTWFWLGSFNSDSTKIKIEISKRAFPDQYENKDFFGVSLLTMKPEFMFAHKLCAITDRTTLQNRDLFDAWFMFSSNWQPNEEIIMLRTGKKLRKYLMELKNYILKNVNRKYILAGLGELLDEKQKDWVRQNLADELIFQLEVRCR